MANALNSTQNIFSKKNAEQILKNLCEQKLLPKVVLLAVEPLVNFFNDLIHEAMPQKFIGKADARTLFFRHIVDSLLPLQNEKIFSLLDNSKTIVDLGAGAGLPSIPLAMVFLFAFTINQKAHFYLVDNDSKRINFCLDAKEKYNLTNVTPVYSNADIPVNDSTNVSTKNKKHPPAQIVLFRAFRKPLVSLELALSSLAENGNVLYYRSQEINFLQSGQTRLRQLGYGDFIRYSFITPAELENRGAYIFEKNLKTQKPFPRRFKKIKTDDLTKQVL